MPPALPPGEVIAVPGRGELFVRRADAPADAVPVLLVHGWQATADLNFFPLYAPLAHRHPVIAADLRGHGRSVYPETDFTLEDAADDHAALLRHLGIQRAIIAGYSIGTAVTQVLVERHPDLVAGIVLAAGELRGVERPHETVYLRMGGWIGTAIRLTTGRWGAHRVVSKATRETSEGQHLRAWLIAEMERGHTGSIRAAGRALGRFDGRPIASRHDVAAAVVVTSRDRLVRPRRQHALAVAWGADVVELDADHDAPIAQPAAFVAAMLEAVDRVASESTARQSRSDSAA